MSQVDAALPEAEPRAQLALDILINPTDTGVAALPANKSQPPQQQTDEPDVQSIYEAHTLHRAEAIAARTKQRAERKALLRTQASSHKETADALVDQNKLKAALPHYHEAIRLWYSNPDYHIALAGCFRKLGWFEEAAHSCTTALTLSPTSSSARYLRGVSRLSQRMLLPAKTDFQTVLEHDPTHILARAALSQLDHLLASDPSLLQPPVESSVLTMDYRFPDYDYELLEVASTSDSDESNHVGNGVPCRFYNQLGCVKGTNCEYSHAPDERSVRDLLGRNVCTYHLLSSCKFGISKCVYSHHKDALPAEGWWTSPARIAKIKATLESVEQKKRDLRVLEQERIRLQYRAVKESHQKEKDKAGHHHFPKTPKTAVSFAPDAAKKGGQGKQNGKPPHSATIKKSTPVAAETPVVTTDTAPKAA